MKNYIKIPDFAIRPFNIFIFGVFFYILIYFIVGVIPVGGGSGWDGGVYLDYIARLAAGDSVRGDPYRIIRMSGFLPAIMASHLGLDRGADFLPNCC